MLWGTTLVPFIWPILDILANCHGYKYGEVAISGSCLQCTHGYTDNYHKVTLILTKT